mmetsp:Transcript_7901/g.19618  ORF Transcript_7901/g.19618 Transcript_7901/m.19618 type:complete len:275 (+) Transcript_7901:210-1034(+)
MPSVGAPTCQARTHSTATGSLLAVLARVIDHAVLAGANLVVVARRRLPNAGEVHPEVARRRITADHGRVDVAEMRELVGAPGVLATADLGGLLPHDLREVADHAAVAGLSPEGLRPGVVLDLVVPLVHGGTVRCVRGNRRARPVEVLAVVSLVWIVVARGASLRKRLGIGREAGVVHQVAGALVQRAPSVVVLDVLGAGSGCGGCGGRRRRRDRGSYRGSRVDRGGRGRRRWGRRWRVEVNREAAEACDEVPGSHEEHHEDTVHRRRGDGDCHQ